MVALELEVLSKKMDRFGWERDRNTPAHNRLITDWMDALQDYPLDEVKAACRAAVLEGPHKMPNEGHIVAQIIAERRRFLLMNPPQRDTHDEYWPHKPASRKSASEILKEVGLAERFKSNREPEPE